MVCSPCTGNAPSSAVPARIAAAIDTINNDAAKRNFIGLKSAPPSLSDFLEGRRSEPDLWRCLLQQYDQFFALRAELPGIQAFQIRHIDLGLQPGDFFWNFDCQAR